jgi:hypothetical protein
MVVDNVRDTPAAAGPAATDEPDAEVLMISTAEPSWRFDRLLKTRTLAGVAQTLDAILAGSDEEDVAPNDFLTGEIDRQILVERHGEDFVLEMESWLRG